MHEGIFMRGDLATETASRALRAEVLVRGPDVVHVQLEAARDSSDPKDRTDQLAGLLVLEAALGFNAKPNQIALCEPVVARRELPEGRHPWPL